MIDLILEKIEKYFPVFKAGIASLASTQAATVTKTAVNIGKTAQAICSIISVLVALISLFYIYYKFRNEKMEFKNREKDNNE